MFSLFLSSNFNIPVCFFKNAKKGIRRGEEKCVGAKETTVANTEWTFPFRHRDIDRKRKKCKLAPKHCQIKEGQDRIIVINVSKVYSLPLEVHGYSEIYCIE